ncbi:MAG: hypothetical protein P4L41_00350 [Flavipsychrobacter sp.]|nr:hypothetical protein [Flavipsychrobacter sp.]
MANLNKNIKLNVEGPDSITVKVIREDLLSVSNTYRTFFEVCFGIFCALLGVILSMKANPPGKDTVPFIYWAFLTVMLLGCIVFSILAAKNYKMAKKDDC